MNFGCVLKFSHVLSVGGANFVRKFGVSRLSARLSKSSMYGKTRRSRVFLRLKKCVED